MLTKRLAACAAQVTSGGVVCDVGTDHAYLLAELLQSGRCARAVATDIHAGPLEAAKRTLTEAGVLEQAELFLCDGLTQVQPEGITDVVIAGMGGETIVHILESCPWRQQVHLILQPMTKISTLRQWMAEQGFSWTEQAVQEGEKFYLIFSACAAGTACRLTALEQEVGKLDWTSETARRYANWKQQRFQKLAQHLRQAQRPEAESWETLAEAVQTKLQETDAKGEAAC